MKNFGIRLLLLHHWKQVLKATDAAEKKVEGKETVAVHTVQYWFKSSMKATRASKIMKFLVGH